MEQIQKHVAPVAGRSMHLEVFDGSHDFKHYLAQLCVNFHGLTTTANEKKVNQVWRLIPRCDIKQIWKNHVDDDGLNLNAAAFSGIAEHERDVMLITKEYIASSRMSAPRRSSCHMPFWNAFVSHLHQPPGNN